MGIVDLDLAVFEMEKHVNIDKAHYFRRLAREVDTNKAMILQMMADRFEEVAGFAAGLLATRRL